MKVKLLEYFCSYLDKAAIISNNNTIDTMQ